MQDAPPMTYRFHDVESLTLSMDLGEKLGHFDKGVTLMLAPDTAKAVVSTLKAGHLVEARTKLLDERSANLDAHAEWLIAKTHELARLARRSMNEIISLFGAWALTVLLTVAAEPITKALWG